RSLHDALPISNWIERAAPLPTEGLEICTSGVVLELPNKGLLRLAALPLTVGVYCVLLRTLKTSKRNWPLSRSEIFVSFVSETSSSFSPWPPNRPRAAVPYVPMAGGSSIAPFFAQQPYLDSELQDAAPGSHDVSPTSKTP